METQLKLNSTYPRLGLDLLCLLLFTPLPTTKRVKLKLLLFFFYYTIQLKLLANTENKIHVNLKSRKSHITDVFLVFSFSHYQLKLEPSWSVTNTLHAGSPGPSIQTIPGG